jgi:hypothetical protein
MLLSSAISPNGSPACRIVTRVSTAPLLSVTYTPTVPLATT